MSALQNWKLEYEPLKGDKPKKLRRTISTRLAIVSRRITAANTRRRKMGGGNR